jgi:chromosome segregation ATPase
MKDIADLLEEVQTIVQSLREEKTALEDQVSRLESELSLVKEGKTKEIRHLQEANIKLAKDLQDTKEQLAQALPKTQLVGDLESTKDQLLRELQNTRQKLDHFHPEMQSLQDELQNSEVQNNILTMELTKKEEAIKALENRLSEYTSLISAGQQVGEPIA